VIVALGEDDARAVLDAAKARQKLAVSPILAFGSAEDFPNLDRIYGRDRLVVVRRNSISDAQMRNAAELAINIGSGGLISTAEAQDYADRALSVLRDLAVSGNAVLLVEDARTSLATALGERSGRTRLEIAEVLAHVDREESQMALMDSAIRTNGSEQIDLLAKVGDSAKRFGNLLPERQVRRLLELARADDAALATSAAAVVGALELPNFAITPVILEQSDAAPARADRR